MSIEDKDLVVVLHGIGMSPLRMAWLNFGLKRAGFDTLNIGYPSLRRDIAECATFVQEKIDQSLQGNRRKIHFVTHSMGGLIALELLARNYFEQAGRAVLIAPPHGGSEVADMLQRYKLYRRVFGPAGQQLTTAYRKNISFAVPSTVELGVISGTRAWEYPLFLSTMKKFAPHDGLVSVKSTEISGAKDHITIRMSHSFLLEKSLKETVHFLGHGVFTPGSVRHTPPLPL